MEYKTRLHTHVIVGYSMYKIEATAHFLHLPCGFYTRRAAFTLAVRLLNAGVGDPSRPP